MATKHNPHQLQLASRLVLNEQGSMGGALSPMFSYNMGITNKDRREFASKFWRDHKHDIMMAAEIGAYFIPVAGPLISAGIAAADAAMYWNEGDRETAGLIAILSAIPLIGKIPAVRKLGRKGMAALMKKLRRIQAGKRIALTKLEQSAIKGLSSNKKAIYQQMKALTKKATGSKLAKTTKSISKSAATGYATYSGVKAAWDPVYSKLGLDVADVETQTESDWQRLKQLAQK
jgi:hypothetical protein